MYMIRAVFNCQRGKAGQVMKDFKAINESFKGQGVDTGRLYFDMTGRMDTIVFQFEVDSLDWFYKFERGLYVDVEPEWDKIATRLNENTVEGYREIYEVIV